MCRSMGLGYASTHKKRVRQKNQSHCPLNMKWCVFCDIEHEIDAHSYRSLACSQRSWLNVIQTSCPHLLRYLAASLIIDGERTSLMDDKALRVIQEEKEYYR